MNKIFLSALLISQFCRNAQADSGDVATQVTNSGGVTYIETEDHPSKMNWSNLTFCWGANSKSTTENSNSAEETSISGSGSIDSYAGVSGPLGRMLANHLEWTSTFDKQDMTFKINIKRQLGTSQTAQTSSSCATHDWSYKVNAAKTKVETSVHLTVPPNVWVMRLKTLVNKSRSELQVSQVRAMPTSENHPVEDRNNFHLGGYQYYFTKPGEDFKLELNFDDNEVANIDLVASIEVTFIGFNRCEQTVKNVMGSENAMRSENISQKVQEALAKIENQFLTSSANQTEEMHKAALFIGCLMNKNINESIFHNNEVTDVEKLLQTVETFQNGVNEKTIKDDNYRTVGNAMKLLTQMSKASLIESVLDTVKPYCKKIPVFNDTTGNQVGYKRGYVKISENLKSIRGFIAGNVTSAYFRSFFTQYKNIIRQDKTYAEQIENPVIYQKMTDLANLYEADNKVLLADEINFLLTELPAMPKTIYLLRLAQGQHLLFKTVGKLHSLMEMEFEELANHSSDKRENLDIEEQLSILDSATTDMMYGINGILKNIDAVEPGSHTTEFANSTQAMIADNGREWLAQVYGGYFKDFLASIDPEYRAWLQKQNSNSSEVYRSQTVKEVSECLIPFTTQK